MRIGRYDIQYINRWAALFMPISSQLRIYQLGPIKIFDLGHKDARRYRR